MSYTIVRVVESVYPAFVEELYRQDPALHLRPYAEQLQEVVSRSAFHSDSFTRGMRALGHETHEIIADVEPLQKQWAREHDLEYRPDHHFKQDIIVGQLRHLRPDVVYLQDIFSLPHAVRRQLKQEVSGLRLVVVHKGYPGAADELWDVDLLLAGVPSMVRTYQEAGLRPLLLYHGFDTAILDKLAAAGDPEQPALAHDFVFAGSSGYGYGLAHQRRYWALQELLETTNLEAWVEERRFTQDHHATTTVARFKLLVWNLLRQGLQLVDQPLLTRLAARRGLPVTIDNLVKQALEHKRRRLEQQDPRYPGQRLGDLWPKRCHAPRFGLELHRLLRSSRVVFNLHTDTALGSVGNMRMFETTGLGACLLTDRGENLGELFEDGTEVVSYGSIEQCRERLRYLQENDSARQQIAAAGQARTLRDHTISNRCALVDHLLRKRLG